MAQKRYHELPTGERDAFEAACARHGFVPEDFEVSVQEHAANAQRTISIGRVVGSQFEQYATADGIDWVALFERDLAGDVFGFPLAD
ncbi:hypothetical protein CupriaWKF_09510 [Cupriavidus sp. WKF15]|uniref:hypothetical protein n=1 Tax=Cupriavidus sp. WKF15 TaxID=3032282 RepID=UPI0023E35002|nr:hypothetical protein [Cupriavidus sp. WKF15]WER44589.1 hypothetical protein CupriaWKF_09510 [Cupriavidus sp. WKF15]